jgi:hypothetical protein
MKHKTEDYKLSAVKYYLETPNSMDLEEHKPLPEIKQNLFYQACCMVSQLKYTKDTMDTTTELYESFSQMREFMTDAPQIVYI